MCERERYRERVCVCVVGKRGVRLQLCRFTFVKGSLSLGVHILLGDRLQALAILRGVGHGNLRGLAQLLPQLLYFSGEIFHLSGGEMESVCV